MDINLMIIERSDNRVKIHLLYIVVVRWNCLQIYPESRPVLCYIHELY